jgi:uncharacterized protein YeaO (DUF488 family)
MGIQIKTSKQKATPMVTIKRVYEAPSRNDGTRILVDRLWPRGLKKENIHIEKWMRELGPSNELRWSFGHDPERWEDFHQRYLKELKRTAVQPLLEELLNIARKGKLTLV